MNDFFKKISKKLFWIIISFIRQSISNTEQGCYKNLHAKAEILKRLLCCAFILGFLLKEGGQNALRQVGSHLVRRAEAGWKAEKKGPQGLDGKAGNRVS